MKKKVKLNFHPLILKIELNFEKKKKKFVYLNVIIAVVVQVESAEELRVDRDVDIVGVDHPFAEQLAAVLLHLNVIELSALNKKKKKKT